MDINWKINNDKSIEYPGKALIAKNEIKWYKVIGIVHWTCSFVDNTIKK